MPRKKGLGREMEKTLEAVDQLVDCLTDFSHKNAGVLKRYIGASIEDREAIIKIIDEASTEAHTLKNKIQNLKEKVKGAKSKASSRFARKVVANFLESDITIQ